MDYPILNQKPYLSFRKSLKEYIAKNVKPHALEWEASSILPQHLLKNLGKKGYLGLSLPKSAGGQGKDFWHEVILAEELGTCGALGWALSVLVQTNMLAPLIQNLGSKQQIDNFLKPALRGNYYLALAVTEPDSGSDLASIQCEARLEGDKFIVTGQKRYISNGSIAKYLVVSVKTQSRNDIWSIGFLIIPTNLKGVKIEKLPTAGLKTGDTASITFKNCVVPKENLLGHKGKGFYYLLKGLQRERLIGAVALNSLSLFVLNETISFLKERQRFNEPLSKKQALRHKIAELRSKVEASRQLAYSACEGYSKNLPVDQEIIMVKILCYETAQEVIRECIHLHGAEAFLDTHWLAHAYRDSQAFSLAAGTSEIMKDLLAGMIQM